MRSLSERSQIEELSKKPIDAEGHIVVKRKGDRLEAIIGEIEQSIDDPNMVSTYISSSSRTHFFSICTEPNSSN